MRTRLLLLTATLGLMILSTGCYTKLYRPGMEDNGPFSSNSLYNRYDSTAIDTTLTKPETVDVYPSYDPYYNDSWSYWGRPRGYTRWGFDFDRFSPNYYRSYYGYYDYYSRPWWHDWHHRYPHWGPGTPGAPGEPPSQRPGRRSSEATAPPPVIGNGGMGGGATYAQPAPPPPAAPPTVKDPAPQDDSSQKRNGKRRR